LPGTQGINDFGQFSPVKIFLGVILGRRLRFHWGSKNRRFFLTTTPFLAIFMPIMRDIYCFSVPTSYPIVAIKTTLMRLLARDDLFLIKPLHYKGQLVAAVLIPRFK
jgi:hypothetical protein